MLVSSRQATLAMNQTSPNTLSTKHKDYRILSPKPVLNKKLRLFNFRTKDYGQWNKSISAC